MLESLVLESSVLVYSMITLPVMTSSVRGLLVLICANKREPSVVESSEAVPIFAESAMVVIAGTDGLNNETKVQIRCYLTIDINLFITWTVNLVQF